MQPSSLVKELNRYESLADKLYYIGSHLNQRFPDLERFSVALYHPLTDQVRTFFTTSPLQEAIRHYEFPLGKAASLQYLAEQKQPRVINDLSELVPPKHQGRVNEHTRQLVDMGWKSSFTSPLLCGDELQGFVFFNARRTLVFQGDLLEQLEVYSQLIAQLIDQDHAAIRTLTAAVRSTMSLCSGRDPETGGHLERMAQYTRLIAANLKQQAHFTDRQIQHLLLFAPLHDLGKLAIPDRILLKKGKLTNEEFLEMQKHTTQGAELLDRVICCHGLQKLPDVQLLRNLVLYHHERLDGSGYPQGLAGEAIPIEARIIAVADVFDALTSERPYKKAWPVSEALEELQRMAGSHLDPECVQVLLDKAEEARFILDRIHS